MHFLLVYIREAHPADEWQLDSNVAEGVVYEQPRTQAERTAVADACCRRLDLTLPCVVDNVDDGVESAYAAWPERIYVVGTDGRIKYAGASGPGGFLPLQLERWIRRHTR